MKKQSRIKTTKTWFRWALLTLAKEQGLKSHDGKQKSSECSGSTAISANFLNQIMPMSTI